MGQQLYNDLPAAKELFDRANEVLGYDLKQVIFEGPTEALNATDRSQPALYVCSLAALEKLKIENAEVVERCDYAAGLSLGEYTAIVFAGGMSFEDGLRLVQRRGEAMQAAAEATPSSMVSILGMDRDAVEQLCNDCRTEGQTLQIANLLCPGNIVVSGDQQSCDTIAERAKDAGAMKAIPLAVAGAFHTRIMGSAVDKLRDALADVEISKTRIPVVSNVDAQPHHDPAEIRELLVKQVCAPVLWEDSLRWMMANEMSEYYEVGPGRVLRGLMKRIARKMPSHGVMDA
jgi:[acyl-carrier-protein] S-malonyltransferase